MAPRMTRRSFARNSAAAALALASGRAAAAPAGVNERVRLGCIGVGNRGSHILKLFHDQPDVEIVAVCDVYERFLTRAKGLAGGGAATYKDFRQVLERQDVDAVVLATPDHWHALQTIPACQAGKEGAAFLPPPPPLP